MCLSLRTVLLCFITVLVSDICNSVDLAVRCHVLVATGDLQGLIPIFQLLQGAFLLARCTVAGLETVKKRIIF